LSQSSPSTLVRNIRGNLHLNRKHFDMLEEATEKILPVKDVISTSQEADASPQDLAATTVPPQEEAPTEETTKKTVLAEEMPEPVVAPEVEVTSEEAPANPTEDVKIPTNLKQPNAATEETVEKTAVIEEVSAPAVVPEAEVPTEETAEIPTEVEEVPVNATEDAKAPANFEQQEKAITEIEDKVAEISEEGTRETLEMVDYSQFSLEALVEALSALVKEHPVQSISAHVNKIKSTFNVQFGSLLKKEKEAFLEAGGNVVDFQYKNPIKVTYNSILYDYKIKRNEFFENQQKELQANLAVKLEVIEALKHLVDTAHGSEMYKHFKELQDRWQAAGAIPRTKYKDVWRTYHHHVERFYDLLHLSNDLRDLDFKHNLEEKLKLVDKAEALAEMGDVNKAFKGLQELHKLWKEEIGPVAREHRESVWNRFSAATKKIHDKRHLHFKDIKSSLEANIPKKLSVIAEIDAYDTTGNKSRSAWQKSIQEVQALREKFFAIGQVPRAKNDEIWEKFKVATKKFNSAKNRFFKDIKKEQLDNLNKKRALVEQAASLKDSEDWDSTTECMKKIQADWKKIGHVPRKYSDKLWKEFKEACNYYFDRLHKEQDKGNAEQFEVLQDKKTLLKEIKQVFDDQKELAEDQLKGYIQQWNELGALPSGMRHVDVKFNKLIDKIAALSSFDKMKLEMIKFQNLVGSYVAQKNYRKLDSEKLFVRKKMDESIKEIQQLENNIGFISNVSDDNPLLENVRSQIAICKERLSLWKSKIDYLKRLEIS